MTVLLVTFENGLLNQIDNDLINNTIY